MMVQLLGRHGELYAVANMEVSDTGIGCTKCLDCSIPCVPLQSALRQIASHPVMELDCMVPALSTAACRVCADEPSRCVLLLGNNDALLSSSKVHGLRSAADAEHDGTAKM